ncbi:MAG: phosphate/phosphite/phosphonate ABC transporter substrate-binding protein [Planctomycetes bacterium]|nr:phosphate/phosphite/phosphonate ABC transporter substrate-binding protein [Planctomycetota bacterium]
MLNRFIIIIAILFIILTGIIIYTVYYPPAGAQKVDLGKTVPLEHHKDTPSDSLRVAIGGIVSPRETAVYYNDLLACISEKIDKPIVIVQRSSYVEINDLLKNGQVDCAFVCSGPYVAAHDEFGAELLVVPVVNGTTFYCSYIIVHKDSPFQSINDLRGKNFAISQVLSSTGRIYPAYLVTRRDSTIDVFFSKTTTIPGHDNIIKAVAEKWIDGGAVNSFVWDYMAETQPKYTSQTRIIHKSPQWGNPPFIVRKDLDVGLKKKLQEVLLNMHTHPSGGSILKEKLLIDKFVEGDDKWYNPIRDMLKGHAK